jgi:hypothetical protein
MKGQHRVEITHGRGRSRRQHYVGTFKHAQVASEVERRAKSLLEAGDKDAFAELMDRYVKNRTDEDGSGAQVA